MNPGATVSPVQSIRRLGIRLALADGCDPVRLRSKGRRESVAAGSVQDGPAVQQHGSRSHAVPRRRARRDPGIPASPVPQATRKWRRQHAAHFRGQRRRIVFAHLRNRAGDADGGGHLAGLVENRRADAAVARSRPLRRRSQYPDLPRSAASSSFSFRNEHDGVVVVARQSPSPAPAESIPPPAGARSAPCPDWCNARPFACRARWRV